MLLVISNNTKKHGIFAVAEIRFIDLNSVLDSNGKYHKLSTWPWWPRQETYTYAWKKRYLQLIRNIKKITCMHSTKYSFPLLCHVSGQTILAADFSHPWEMVDFLVRLQLRHTFGWHKTVIPQEKAEMIQDDWYFFDSTKL